MLYGTQTDLHYAYNASLLQHPAAHTSNNDIHPDIVWALTYNHYLLLRKGLCNKIHILSAPSDT